MYVRILWHDSLRHHSIVHPPLMSCDWCPCWSPRCRLWCVVRLMSASPPSAVSCSTTQWGWEGDRCLWTWTLGRWPGHASDIVCGAVDMCYLHITTHYTLVFCTWHVLCISCVCKVFRLYKFACYCMQYCAHVLVVFCTCTLKLLHTLVVWCYVHIRCTCNL